jgi:hypothetical protein
MHLANEKTAEDKRITQQEYPHILIKLSAILSLVFVPFFVQYGGILLKFM